MSESYNVGGKYSNFISSSFQFLLQVITSDSQRNMHNNLFSYISFIRYTETLIFSKTQHNSYSYNSFKYRCKFPKKLMFESVTRAHLNIRILRFSYFAQHEDFNCKYGGVSMFDIILDHMEETRSDCTTRLDHQFNLQPFYSKNNKTIIVLYSYHHYSNLWVSINVSVSDCHVVKINLCDMNLVCRFSVKLCSAYFDNETISIKGEKISSNNFKLTFQPEGENCVNIHVQSNPYSYLMPFPNLHRKKKHVCSMQFCIELRGHFVVYQYDISGYLSNIDSIFGWYQRYYAFGTPYKYDAMHNISVVHWANGTKEFLGNLNESNQDVFIVLKPHNGRNVAFEANILEKTPSHKDSVWFQVALTRWIS